MEPGKLRYIQKVDRYDTEMAANMHKQGGDNCIKCQETVYFYICNVSCNSIKMESDTRFPSILLLHIPPQYGLNQGPPDVSSL